MAKTSMPDINGFTFSSLKTMVGEDGYITRCNLLFEGRKVGEYFDPADGSQYRFYAEKDFSESRIEEVIGSFPPVTRDYGLGPKLSTVPYSIGIMVDELIRKRDLLKTLVKYQAKDKDLVTVDCWERNQGWLIGVPRLMGDEQMRKALAGLMVEKGVEKYESRRYRSTEDLNDRNTKVTIDMLR